MLFVSNFRRALLTATTLAISFCLALTAQADGDLRTVALTGHQVPGAEPGVRFGGSVAPPALNAAGQTAFVGGLIGSGVDSTNDSGIYLEEGGTLREVAREGNQAPGANPGVVFGPFYPPLLDAAGHTSFRNFLAGPGVNFTNEYAIYSDGTGTLVEVARGGSQVPGANPGVKFFFYFSVPSIVLNSPGQTAFRAELNGEGVISTNDEGIYSQRGGTLAEVARAGNQAPDAGAGVVFRGFSDPVLNSTGRIAFFGELSGTGVNGANNSGIYSQVGGTLAEVTREGNQAPGAAPGVVFSFPDSTSPVLNSAGQTAFRGFLTGPGVDSTNNSGIYSGWRGSLEEVARAGNQAPSGGQGVVFVGFSAPVINAAGQTAFGSRLTGTGLNSLNDYAIYSDGTGTLAEVARAGSQAPGANPGVVLRFFLSPMLNAAGQTAFENILAGPGVNSTNDFGLYATDRNGQLVEIVREGNVIDVNDDPLVNDLRTISSFSVATNTGNEDGRPSGFNDVGQLAFSAQFTDGTSGIFVSNRVAVLPEPGDFDLDGDVDGRDFLAWQRNPAVGDLVNWQLNYGFNSPTFSAATVVPEPATAALLALCLQALLPRRIR
ncbi:DUF7453 family protein [Bythopirellula goksoeyrii]|uniref:Phytase-like domain-containing protein n=1 Tax=Bythopirellula goksoeyrii TaxID=1400387 RepID=A0A5B9Q6C1_9BACT|nr:choice-of-anchor tandem repeat NxxGxxAF-containing protein [Bythopirellula goksoeyrii]QEG34568.1 hypothetical protein Pr1d_18490 [Bythopirellula goksoeyrii]